MILSELDRVRAELVAAEAALMEKRTERRRRRVLELEHKLGWLEREAEKVWRAAQG